MSELAVQRTLRVFLASPGDLEAERRAAWKVTDEVNSSVGRVFGIHVDLLGWEDTLPGLGRPQGHINADVDRCHLFVGVLFKRWGTSPGGGYTSGFEEEFDRAIQRSNKTAEPEIWLAFKRIEPEALADPGEQLRRVIGFRQAQEASRQVFFKEFVDTEDWTTQLRKWLSQRVAELGKKEIETLKPPPAPAAPIQGGTPAGVLTASASDSATKLVPEQILELGKRLGEAMQHANYQSYVDAFANLAPTELRRLSLLVNSWQSFQLTHEILSTHEINTLYRSRTELQLVPPEPRLLFRTLLGWDDDVVPGWYWFSRMRPDILVEQVLDVAMHDAEARVKEAARRLLQEFGIRPPSSRAPEVFGTLLGDPTVQGLKYVGAFGTLDELPLVEDLRQSDDFAISREADEAALLIRLRADPAETLRLLIERREDTPEAVLQALNGARPGFETEAILPALEGKNARIRVWSAWELLRRGALDSARAGLFLTDSSLGVREVGLRALITLREPLTPSRIREVLDSKQTGSVGILPFIGTEAPPDPDSVVLELFATLTFEQLVSSLDWWSGDSHLAYRVLATRHFDRFAARMRADLSTEFEALAVEAAERERQRFGPAAESLISQIEKLRHFLVGRHAAAALAGLEINGSPADIDFARGFLTRTSEASQVEAIRMIGRWGDASDVPQLVNIAKGTYGETKEAAARAAMKLSPEIRGAAVALVETGDPLLVGIALSLLGEAGPQEVRPLLWPLLFDEKPAIRAKAVACVVARFSDLELVLEEYLQAAFYYYNVACWLDRVLYSVAPLADGYRMRLSRELDT